LFNPIIRNTDDTLLQQTSYLHDKDITTDQWLQLRTANLQVVGLDPAYAWDSGICFCWHQPFTNLSEEKRTPRLKFYTSIHNPLNKDLRVVLFPKELAVVIYHDWIHETFIRSFVWLLIYCGIKRTYLVERRDYSAKLYYPINLEIKIRTVNLS